MRNKERLYSITLASISLLLFLILISFVASAESSNDNILSNDSIPSDIKISQITASGSAQNPDIYKDRIVYSDHRNGKCHIYMYNLSTSEDIEITSSKYSVFNPDIYEDRIVWCERFEKDYGIIDGLINSFKSSIRGIIEFIIRFPIGPHNPDDIKCNISVYNLSTHEKTQIASNESYQASPEIFGDRIVWEGMCDTNGTHDIYMYNLSTHRKIQITTSGSAFSPFIYGDRIIYYNSDDGNQNVFMYNLSTSDETQFPIKDSWQGGYAIFENKIVFVNNNNFGKSADIYLHDLATQQETKVTTNGSAQFPAIYGDRVVWTRKQYDTQKYDIYMYDFSTKKETQISTSGTACFFYPAIYGDTIVWEDTQFGDRRSDGITEITANIYLCNLNSTSPPVTISSEPRK